ncbi:MAG TPA: GNAT family N-acetyltransferase [Solirubrobacter sp.]|nr:GNAT family N-acetyltransferase [Solirubrobacter sp.]
MDAAALEIRPAVPEDAAALADTSLLGFETYRSWADEAWRPPPRSLTVYSVRDRLRRPETWCVLAVEPDGGTPGHVGLTQAVDRERPHASLAGWAHLWALFVRPDWWGTGLAARLHALALETAAGRGYASMRLYTPYRAARARAFYEREGWTVASRAFAEPMLGLDLVEYRRSL